MFSFTCGLSFSMYHIGPNDHVFCDLEQHQLPMIYEHSIVSIVIGTLKINYINVSI